MSGDGRDGRHLDWAALDRVRTHEGTGDEREHVAGCAPCRAELDRIEQLARSARASASGGGERIPASVESAILAAARERAGAIRSGKLVRLPLWKRLRPLAIAASLLVGVSAVYVTYRERGLAPADSGSAAPRSDLDAARGQGEAPNAVFTGHAAAPASAPVAAGGKAEAVGDAEKQKELATEYRVVTPKREEPVPQDLSEAKKAAKDADWPPSAFRTPPAQPAPAASTAPVVEPTSRDQKAVNEKANQPEPVAGVRQDAFDKRDARESSVAAGQLAASPTEFDRRDFERQLAPAPAPMPAARPLAKTANELRDERGADALKGLAAAGAASTGVNAPVAEPPMPVSPPALQSKVEGRPAPTPAPCVNSGTHLGGLLACGGANGMDVAALQPTSSELEIELAPNAGPTLARIRQSFTVVEPQPGGIYATPAWAQAQPLRLEGTVEGRDRAEASFVDLESRGGRPGWNDWDVPAPIDGDVRLTLTTSIPPPIRSSRVLQAKILGQECPSLRPPVELTIPGDVIAFVRGANTGAPISIVTSDGTRVATMSSPSHALGGIAFTQGKASYSLLTTVLEARGDDLSAPLVLVLSICDERANPATAPAG